MHKTDNKIIKIIPSKYNREELHQYNGNNSLRYPCISLTASV